MVDASPASIAPVAGIRLGSAAAGIRYRGRDDLVVMELAPASRCAAVFTRNAFCAAPVVLARRHLAATAPRYLLINSGNANAGTGASGLEAAAATCRLLGQSGGCPAEAVLPFSTGVIGEPLPLAPFEEGIPAALADLAAEGWERAARAIMTTDTRAKLISRRVELPGGGSATITGMAKGSGMIRPDMATMLAFVATDLAVAPALLQQALERAVAPSFNSITVDGDTSTNDACVLVASGAAPVAPLEGSGDPRLPAFQAALEAVCMGLARAIVRDGEGATKLAEIRVEQAASVAEARQVAYTVAHSPLVKTALFASDPNWGRILAAVGRAGVEALEIERVQLWLGEVCIVRGGGRAPEYSEAAGQAAMAGDEITIRILLGRGEAQGRILTCDLSYDYVRINAEYRT